MRGWMLYENPQAALDETDYEVHQFIAAAARHNIAFQVVAPGQFDLVVTRDDRTGVLLDGQTTPLPDFLLPYMGAGTTYFAFAIIRHLEQLGVEVINPSASIESVKDKLYTQQILAATNLPVPKTLLVKFPVDSGMVQQHLGFPVIVKTLYGSRGTGVYLSETRPAFDDLMSLLAATQGNANIILQEFIQASYGHDLRVLVVGGRVIACMERIANDGSFKANISRGGTGHRFDLSPEVELLALEAARVLGLDIAGVDLLFEQDGFMICEVNSSPGFLGLETTCPELSVAEEIFRYIRVRLAGAQSHHLAAFNAAPDHTEL